MIFSAPRGNSLSAAYQVTGESRRNRLPRLAVGIPPAFFQMDVRNTIGPGAPSIERARNPEGGMKLGPKMEFILRVYQMTEAENAEDIERDKQMVTAGTMSSREFWKRSSTRYVARNIRRRDEQGSWPH